MEIRISALKFAANESQLEFITKKVERLERFCADDSAVAEVVMSLQNEDKKIRLTVGSNIIERSADTFENAVTACVDAMKEKLVREKEKTLGR